MLDADAYLDKAISFFGGQQAVASLVFLCLACIGAVDSAFQGVRASWWVTRLVGKGSWKLLCAVGWVAEGFGRFMWPPPKPKPIPPPFSSLANEVLLKMGDEMRAVATNEQTRTRKAIGGDKFKVFLEDILHKPELSVYVDNERVDEYLRPDEAAAIFEHGLARWNELRQEFASRQAWELTKKLRSLKPPAAQPNEML